ncbi:MAG: tetratricopeptide repeat protein [Planctomycetes bacterium]|nr:tetratricopeptide repeat protein [Planctomycetota bacterium]
MRTLPSGLVLAAALAAVLAVAARGQEPAAGNSTRKERVPPSAVAQRCGSAIRWVDSLDAALAVARETGRPVFWYVPTVPGSRMDRGPELDLYVRAGPLSWPALIALLDAHFVALRAVPSRTEARERGLVPIGFVEPGFVVLAPDGSERLRVDEVTTFAPRWFVAKLLEALPADARRAATRSAELWPLARATDPDTPGARFERGAACWERGDDDGARQVWQALVADHPESPVAWKAQAELEGHGPFVRGFEVFDELLPAVLAGTGRGTRAPAGAFDEAALRERAVAFFARMQRADGGFVDSIYDFGGTDSLPNVYTAVTALVALALLDVVPQLDGELRATGERVLLRARDYAADDAHLNPVDRDELIWAHLYRCRLLARWLDVRPGDAERIRPLLRRAVDAIAAMQGSDGAWYHEYPNPFVSGSCLVALGDARRHGVEAPEPVVDRGLRALLQCRADSGAVSYGQSRGRVRAGVEGGVGRMPLAEHALALWSHGEDGALLRALELSFRYQEELDAVRKYDDHASRYGYGGFFYWYDVHVRGEAILRLPDGETRDALLARQRALVLSLPELDGCFVDSHELGRVYGTAMAMICLARAAAD